MAAITAALIKQVREETGAGMMDVKKALTEAEGDVARAKEIIRAKGIQAAGKREGRKAQEGTIASQVVESVFSHVDIQHTLILADTVSHFGRITQKVLDLCRHLRVYIAAVGQ